MKTSTQEINVNINTQVKVLLTDYGREVLKKHYEELNCLEHMPDPTQELKMPIWDLAKIFGEVLYMGNTKIPFVDNEIKMDFKINEEGEIETFN